MKNSTPASGPERYFASVRPLSELHLGHYFGSVRNPILKAKEGSGRVYFLIADTYALATMEPERRSADSASLGQHTEEAAATIAACFEANGVDDDRWVLYRQSDVPEVFELAWLLGAVTPIDWLASLHFYKDRRRRGRTSDVGHLAYPLLLAADILLVGATRVIAGRDQRQHVETARRIAHKFQYELCRDETIFEDFMLEESDCPFVHGTDGEKMSTVCNNTIGIFAHGGELRRTLARAEVDHWLFSLHELVTGEKSELAELEAPEAKESLAQAIERRFEPYRRARSGIGNGDMRARLARGAEEVGELARARLLKLRRIRDHHHA